MPVSSIGVVFSPEEKYRGDKGNESRARVSLILYSRIRDGREGTSSYATDLPHGVVAYIIGNEIQQGPRTENLTMVSFGAEGYADSRNELYFIDNTLVNDRIRGGRFVSISAGAGPTVFRRNRFIGRGEVPDAARTPGNVHQRHRTGRPANSNSPVPPGRRRSRAFGSVGWDGGDLDGATVPEASTGPVPRWWGSTARRASARSSQVVAGKHRRPGQAAAAAGSGRRHRRAPARSIAAATKSSVRYRTRSGRT